MNFSFLFGQINPKVIIDSKSKTFSVWDMFRPESQYNSYKCNLLWWKRSKCQLAI